MGVVKFDTGHEDNSPVGSMRRIDQVCELASAGLTDIQIAQQLSISKHTVVNYWRKLREIYQMSNRTALVVRHLNSSSEQKIAELESRNKLLAERNGRLIAENAKLRDARLTADGALILCLNALNLAKAFVFKVTAEPPYRCLYMSPSASQFGLDVDAFLSNRCSWFDVVFEEDIQTLMELTENASAPAGEQDCLVFRLKGKEPVWVIEIQRPIVDPSDGQKYYVGLVLNADSLVRANALRGQVARICHSQIAEHAQSGGKDLLGRV